MNFSLKKTSKKSKARLGELKTKHGKIQTPFFMPVATLGTVKSLDSEDVKSLNPQIILGNTYHLYLQPGMDVIKKARGLHNFMNWGGPILTDSGGFQVFSLAKIRKIKKDGVVFQSHINGEKHFLSPEKAIKIQTILGSDIAMSFDVCPPYTKNKKENEKAMKLTTQWGVRGKKEFKKLKNNNLLFGIIQGGTFKDLRVKHTKEIVDIGFDGYALGGLAVGEPVKNMYKAIEWCEPHLPKNKPRYLMGTGYPEQLIEAVKRGIDMFDCVIPTREARHGRLYLWTNESKKPRSYKLKAKNWYKTIDITKSKFKKDMSPINNSNLKGYSKAYLHHLFKAKEPLSIRLATLNNVKFYLDLMGNIRGAIKKGIL